MLRRFSINFAVFSIIIDMLMVVGSMLLSILAREWMKNFTIFKPIPDAITLPLPLFLVFPIITVLIFAIFDLYDGKKFLRIVDEFGALTLSWMIITVSLAGILYFSYRDVSRAQYIVFIILAYILILFWRSSVRLYFRLRNDQREEGARRVLVIGSGPIGQQVGKGIIEQSIEHLYLEGYIDDENLFDEDNNNLLGGFDDVVTVAEEYRISDVVIALPYSAYPNLSRIVSALDEMPVRVWVALGFFDITLYRMGVADFAGIPMLDLRAPALNEYQLLTKRLFDLIIGSLAIVLFSPLIIIAAIGIWLEDRAPVIYRQKRVGENGRIFTIYKFRTMIPGAEELQAQVEQYDQEGKLIHKNKEDPRITRIGRIIRRTSIDELPQLYNVIRGTMSLVGPRPELPYLVEKYQPWQRKRFSVPPGMTGWWQVIGRSDRPMHLHTEDDLYYIQNYSILLDIEILIRTIWVVMIGLGSY